jgi:hypothetical protein
VVPHTGRQNFDATICHHSFSEHMDSGHDNIDHPLTPTADPPGQIGGTGHYSSPRGCNAIINTFDATFDGIDGDDGSGVRLPFSGPVRVTK